MTRRITTFSRAAMLAALAIAAMGAQARPQLILNGGFEDTIVDNDQFTSYGIGAQIGEWTVVGDPDGAVAVVSTNYREVAYLFPARMDLQWLDLTGASNNRRTGVAQWVHTKPGRTYELSFWVSNIRDFRPFPIHGKTSTVDVEIDDALVTQAVNKDKNAPVMGWKRFTHRFTATSDRTKVAFFNADPRIDNCNGLDSVGLRLLPL